MKLSGMTGRYIVILHLLIVHLTTDEEHRYTASDQKCSGMTVYTWLCCILGQFVSLRCGKPRKEVAQFYLLSTIPHPEAKIEKGNNQAAYESMKL